MDGVSSRLVDPSVPPLPARLETGQKAHSSAALLWVALAIGTALELWAPPSLQTLFTARPFRDLIGLSALGSAVAASILLHEAGHAFAAILLNFELVGLTVGPFRVSRLRGEWGFQIWPERMFFGSVSAVPRTMKGWRARMLLVIASGPAATFLAGLFSVWAVFHWAHNSWAAMFFASLAQLSFFIFTLGLLPNRAAARMRNDMRLFISVWRNAGDADEIRLYHLVMQLQIAGVRPRDYSRLLMERLAAKQGRVDAMLLFAQTITNWAVDRGKIPTARAWTRREEELAENCHSDLRSIALARSACLAVTFAGAGDIDDAKQNFSEVCWKALSPSSFAHRAKAAYWLAHGHAREALAEIARSQFALPKNLPLYEFEHSLLARLHARALASTRSGPRLACVKPAGF